MTNTWQQILIGMYSLSDIFSNGPKINLELSQNITNKWTIKIVEQWPDTVAYPISNGDLDQAVEWTSVELKKWKQSRRTSWNSWEFTNKRTAEKFITFYRLACPVQI